MRRVLAIIAGAATASLGALILGEYPFTGATPYVAALLFGLAVTEVVLAIDRFPRPVTVASAPVLTLAGMIWSVWISTNHLRSPIPSGGWLAPVLGAAASVLWFRTVRTKPDPR